MTGEARRAKEGEAHGKTGVRGSLCARPPPLSAQLILHPFPLTSSRAIEVDRACRCYLARDGSPCRVSRAGGKLQ